MNEEEKNVEQADSQKSGTESHDSSPLILGLKYLESFLTNLIWGILIKSLIIRIPKFIYDVTKRFFSWIFRNLSAIIEVLFRIIKITFLVTVLAVIIFWPCIFNGVLFAAWLFLVVIPGVGWGIIRWRRHQKKQQDEEKSPDQIEEDSKHDKPEPPAKQEKEEK